MVLTIKCQYIGRGSSPLSFYESLRIVLKEHSLIIYSISVKLYPTHFSLSSR